jgi:hypothetical protein
LSPPIVLAMKRPGSVDDMAVGGGVRSRDPGKYADPGHLIGATLRRRAELAIYVKYCR